MSRSEGSAGGYLLPHGVPETVYISFSAEINPHTTESLIAAIANVVNQGVKKVYLLMSTPGGAVMNGMNLYNVLRGLPVELTTHNVGNVDSIGTALFLAGAKRYACPHSTFMFHGVGFNVPQGARLEEKFLRERGRISMRIPAARRKSTVVLTQRNPAKRRVACPGGMPGRNYSRECFRWMF